ncbi:MAG: CAP domain-containing protein [Chloroflexota bacterium]
MPSLLPASGRSRSTLATILALVVASGAVATHPLPAAATSLTAASAEASLLAWTNRDRAALGLRPLRSDRPLVVIAGTRAENLAAASTFSHAAAGGDLAPALSVAGVRWYAWGEDIARRPGWLTSSTVAGIYQAWRRSASHWALLMSRTMNYVGFGVAVRPSDGQVFASAVFTESRDRTAPSAKVDRATRSGTTITFAWHGYDPRLQTHWAGLRDYDVWYRVDGGSWRLIRDNTTATSLRLGSRAHGHRYWLTVRARDRAGNVGRQSAPISVWVP